MRTYYLTPVGLDAALTSVSLGTVRALERLGLKTGFVKPLADTLYPGKDAERSRHFAEKLFGIQTPEPMHTDHAEKLLSEGKKDLLMEELVTLFQQAAIGNNVTIAPKAKLNDGLLDIVIVQKMHKAKLAFAVFKQIRGNNKLQYFAEENSGKAVLYFQTAALTIKNLNNAPLHIDGDPCKTADEFKIEILKDCFELIRP